MIDWIEVAGWIEIARKTVNMRCEMWLEFAERFGLYRDDEE